MKTHVILADFKVVEFRFSEPLDMFTKPQIKLTGVNMAAGINIDFLLTKYCCISFFDTRISEGDNFSLLNWEEKKLNSSFRYTLGIEFFAHSNGRVEFDFEIDRVTIVQDQLKKPEAEIQKTIDAKPGKGKRGRTSGIRDEGF
jgi:hypothetical protein